ncbi:caspase family protein [Candidatus Uabimicrobium amorphum]|uniref:Peptidase C14 n=1 Tax=Uabimicrobium amorphum TaxID=2596890 RepID=A0A5S9F5D5_UABAM|nr:caspase family protein [Candidatus Uabimicrobium amorphum]BBM86191.1 peptidase C14 [Candidatus Uabimicrobium amorphum]
MIRIIIFVTLFITSCQHQFYSRDDLSVERKLPQSKEAIFPKTQLQIEAEMHNAPIRKILADDNGRYLVTASLDKTTRIWFVDSGSLHVTLRTPINQGREGKIYAASISPDGDFVAIGGWTGLDQDHRATIYVFEVQTGKLVKSITGLPNVIMDLEFSKNGAFLVAALGGKHGIRVYQTNNYSLFAKDIHYDGAVSKIRFNNRNQLATASRDGHIRTYNNLFLLTAKQAITGQPHSLDFSPDGLRLAIGFLDIPEVAILSTANLKKELTLSTQDTKGFPHSVCWAIDNSLYAGGSLHKTQNRKFLRRWYNAAPDTFQDILLGEYDVSSLFSLVDGSIAFATVDPTFGILYQNNLLLYKSAPVIDNRKYGQYLKVSPDGLTVQFRYGQKEREQAYFSLIPLAKGLNGFSQKIPRDHNGNTIPFFAAITESPKIKFERNQHSFRLNGKDVRFSDAEIIRCVAFDNANKKVVVGSDLYLRCFNTQAQLVWQAAVSEACHVNITRNGKFVIATMADGCIRWYSLENGDVKLTFFQHKDLKRWVVWNPRGAFASSANGESLLVQHKNREDSKLPNILSVSSEFRRPKTVAQSLGVTSPTLPPTALKNIQEQQVVDPFGNIFFEDNTDADEQSSRSLQAELTSAEKKQKLEKERPDLYILSIGISLYKNPRWQLQFAAKDAKDFIDNLQNQKQQVYRSVRVKTIVDSDATRANILDGLEWIKRQSTAKDMVMIFLSGHGENDNHGGYYFLPYNFLPDSLPLTAISFAQLQRAIASFVAKTVFFVDTCRSGGILSGKRIDIDSQIQKLSSSKSKDLVIFASSAGQQLSLENQEWGNGAFTKALLEGLAGKSDLMNTGEVTVSSLYLYISNRVKELTDRRQTPTLAIPNNSPDFVITKLKD